MIIIRGREPIIPQSERQIGTNYDANSENRQFQIKRFSSNGVDLAALDFKLNLEYADRTLDTCLLDAVVDDENITLNWEIPASCVQQKGTVWASVRGHDANGTVKWATNRCHFYVGGTVDSPGASSGQLTELEQLEARIQEKTNTLDANEANRQAAEAERVQNEETRQANEAMWQQQAEEAIREAQNTVKEAQYTLSSAQESEEAASKSAANAAQDAETAETKAREAAGTAERLQKILENMSGFDGSASSVAAVDTEGLVVDAGKDSNVQALINAIAAKVVNELVTSETFSQTLAGYLTKSGLVNNALATEAGVAALDAVMGKTLADKDADLQRQITEQNSDLDTRMFPTGQKISAALFSQVQGGHVYGYVCFPIRPSSAPEIIITSFNIAWIKVVDNPAVSSMRYDRYGFVMDITDAELAGIIAGKFADVSFNIGYVQ